jgi:hypothetical protein
MKQALKVCGGVNRREREKRCGRNVVGRGIPGVEWTSYACVAKGRETPRKVLGAFGLRAGDKQHVLEGEVELIRG